MHQIKDVSLPLLIYFIPAEGDIQEEGVNYQMRKFHSQLEIKFIFSHRNSPF